MTALQHRGQDAAGVVTFSHRFHMKKGLGLVNAVFHDEHDADGLPGHAGLGHVRYATQGSTDILDAQPFAVNYPFGLAMVHNGNVTNFEELQRRIYTDEHRLLETSNDLELILYTLAGELEKKDLGTLTVDDIFDSVESLQAKVEGAYSVVTIIANKGMLAFRDMHGIRPLVLGKKYTSRGIDYAFASESTVFDYLGFETVRELEPGEAMFVDSEGALHSRAPQADKAAFCVFEYIYFAREDAMMNGRMVATTRVAMGKSLARAVRAAGLEPDIVIDVPSSAYFAASGLAEALGVPYRRGLSKNNHIGRSFIVPDQVERERLVRQKLNPIRGVLEGKKVAVVDDSIVRGTTAKHIVRLIRESGAREVYFISAAPPIKYPCVYGIDIAIRREIIAANYDISEIKNYIGADAVVYPELSDLKEIFTSMPGCYACFSGQYPTEVEAGTLSVIERERLLRKASC
jgi:amidophosphoribosyltransferase